MNDFMEQLDRDLDQVFLNAVEFAEVVEFIPSGGTSRPVRAIFDRESIEVDPQTQAQILSTEPKLTLQASDLPEAGRVGLDDRFRVRGQLFRPAEPPRPDGTGLLEIFLEVTE